MPGTSNIDKLQSILADKFDIIERIAAGGMGEIYLAVHKALGQKRAIKIIHQTVKKEKDIRRRFLREARLAASIDHPGIIQIIDFGSEDDFDYLIMPYIDGVTLRDKLEAGEYGWSRYFNMMISMAKAISHAHKKNIIHRDIKPANFMIDAQGRIILTDFGISKNMSEAGMTATNMILGSPKFMSPEQITGKPVDKRSDLYSLGMVYYQMVTGKYPFAGEGVTSVMYKQVHETPPHPSDVDTEVPIEIGDIIMKLLSKDPDARYPDGDSLLNDLLKSVHGNSGPATELIRSETKTDNKTPEEATRIARPYPTDEVIRPDETDTEKEAANNDKTEFGTSILEIGEPFDKKSKKKAWIFTVVGFVAVTLLCVIFFSFFMGENKKDDDFTRQRTETADTGKSVEESPPTGETHLTPPRHDVHVDSSPTAESVDTGQISLETDRSTEPAPTPPPPYERVSQPVPPRPEIRVDNSSITESIEAGESVKRKITVYNDGTAVLSLVKIDTESQGLPEFLKVDKTAMDILPGDAGHLTCDISAAKLSAGDVRTGRIILSTADPQIKSKRIDVRLTVTGAVKAPAAPIKPSPRALVVRSKKILEREILSNIDLNKGALSIADVRKFHKLSVGCEAQGNVDQYVTQKIESFLADNPLARIPDDGECDILITQKNDFSGEKLVINCNLYDCSNHCSEEYSIDSNQIPLDKLDRVIKRNYCFNIFNTLHVTGAAREKGKIDLSVPGKMKNLFVVGEQVKFCMLPDFESHCMLLDINIDGVFKLFPIFREQRDRIGQGETQCSIDIKVSPPTGNEMIVALGANQGDLISTYSHKFNETNPIVMWGFDNASTQNAIKLSETLCLSLINSQAGNWSVSRKFIRIMNAD